MAQLTQFELSKEYLERFQIALEKQDDTFLLESLTGVNPADISALLHEFDTEQSKYVIDLLGPEIGSDIVRDLDEDVRTKFLKIFNPVEIAEFINLMDSDDAADILNELGVKERENVIARLGNEEKEANIIELLRYEEDVAGGLMAKELIKANLNWSVVQCIEEIRRQAENVQKIYSVYVVDNENHLLGRVSLKKIILSDDNTKINDIFEKDVIRIETSAEQEEVASVMQKYDLDAIPVVDVRGRLVGRITIDDIVDVITETAEEERQLMAGISEDVEEDDSVWMLSRARLPWLLIGMTGGMVGAKLIDTFQEGIVQLTIVISFIPLIQATGGNVGIQSSSIVVQSLANKSVFGHTLFKRLIKVLLVAILNGLVLSGMVFMGNFLLGTGQEVAMVVSIALFSVVLIASFVGTITPLILDRVGINPALASGPFITTTNDILGLAIYFLTIHSLL